MTDEIHDSYDRPALLRLAGELQGARVLDAGGGVGALSVELLRRQAEVSLCDLDARACAEADRILGAWVDVRCVDLTVLPWPYEDKAFDLVVMSLVLDLVGPLDCLSEVRRVLDPNGRCIVSLRHPGAYGSGDADSRDEVVETATSATTRTWYARSFSIWLNAFSSAGLHVRQCQEPVPPDGGDPWIVVFELVPRHA
ncbi:class I SAM-dependent methyltransferase [Kribbella sp. DT2]|uniref:class I SAM-dependent methyltransferase n=1 Tax=Kribbella sp. DT2 TaxID=3393427 RepID=UPI003CEFBDFB